MSMDSRELLLYNWDAGGGAYLRHEYLQRTTSSTKTLATCQWAYLSSSTARFSSFTSRDGLLMTMSLRFVTMASISSFV